MKKLLFLLLIAISSLTHAEYVSSSYSELFVTYMAEAGTTVKKGQILFKLCDPLQKLRIDELKLKLKRSSSELENNQRN
jgi:hypothetical protein